MSFSKGKRDTARLKALKDEAIKDANRISVYDKKLLRLESTAPLKELLNREKSAAERKAKAAGKAALEAYKTSAAAQLQSVKDAYKQKTTSRKGTELRHKISGIAEDFRQRLLGKSGSKYVPREPVGGVVDICEAIGLMFNFSRIMALRKVNAEHRYIRFSFILHNFRGVKKAYNIAFLAAVCGKTGSRGDSDYTRKAAFTACHGSDY